ncbi:MAG: Hydroxymethylglutaryl-CoA lyase [Bradyrhizobium sp.]|nr:Hydroxymethylglutaryl-CoA lyase [Bradyrhizobium sp.]
MTQRDVFLTEVGPRDGLQISKDFMPTEQKKAWIKAEYEAGVPVIEVCSFVPVKLIPQFSDAAEVLAYANTLPGLGVEVLVPNFKGCERAVAAGARVVTVPVSVSEAHSQSNVRKSTMEQVEEVKRMCELRDGMAADKRFRIMAACSTAFGCTLQGDVSEADVVRAAVALQAAGVDEISLADTVGYANPVQIKSVFTAVRKAVGPALRIEAHFHNTRGLGLANCLAAYEVGVRHFDSTLGGLGGCPYAPNASGNVVTEDLAFMFESMGVATGIDLDKLVAVREMIRPQLPQTEFYGHLSVAGKPKNFAYAHA